MNDKVLQSEHFINRELSWLEFNARVLEEAEDASNPLLERVKFLSIFSSNLDEFFMVRVAGLREQAFGAGVPQDRSPDGMRVIDQLRAISKRTRELIVSQYRCLNELVLPELAQQGIRILPYKELNETQQGQLNDFFHQTVFPILTPMAIDPSHPRPRYHNRGLYLAAALRRRKGLGPKQLLAVVQLPQVLPRLIQLEHAGAYQFVFLEELVSAHLPQLFGGFEVQSSTAFRITRDSDIELLEQEADDMLRLVEERLKARRRAHAVRMEVTANSDDELVNEIVAHEDFKDGGKG